MVRFRNGMVVAGAVMLVAARSPYDDWPRPPAPPTPVAVQIQPRAFPDVRPPDPGTTGYAVAMANGWTACARYAAIHQIDLSYGAPAAIAMTSVDGCPNSQIALNRMVRDWQTRGWPLQGAVALHRRMRMELMRSVSADITLARLAIAKQAGETRGGAESWSASIPSGER